MYILSISRRVRDGNLYPRPRPELDPAIEIIPRPRPHPTFNPGTRKYNCHPYHGVLNRQLHRLSGLKG